MSSDAILISISLLIVAAALIGTALLLSRPKPVAEVPRPLTDEGPEELDGHEPEAPVELAPFTIIHEKELENGQFEVLVDWGQDSIPSAFQGATIKEALEKAHGAAASKKAMKDMRDDY